MATMVQINDLSIISIDKSEDSWEIEGEVLFEEDLSCEFAATYLPDEKELENLSFSIDENSIGNYDRGELIDRIVHASNEYGDE